MFPERNDHPWRTAVSLWAGVLALACSSGCITLGQFGFDCEVPAVPANRAPPELLGRPRKDMIQISISRLRQSLPDVYQLASGDILGVYIEFVLGEEDQPLPVHFPESGDQPPALGYPVPVREDGTLALPLVDPIKVDGQSLSQATETIRRAYIDKEILQPGRDKIIVTLMRRREYRVLVIREEGGAKEGVTKRGTGEIVDLPAYENDVLHALNATGGLPGLDAKNEILILRGAFQDGLKRDLIVAQIQGMRQPCECPPTLPEDKNATRIPIRFYPEDVPTFREQEIILETGDIVYIPSRDQEKYYTGGILQGRELLLPRDYDLDVMAAVSVAGGQIGTGGTGLMSIGSGGGGGGRVGGGGASLGMSPSRLIVIRKLECGGQVPIRVDLNKAMRDPLHRILVQPEDTLILQYTVTEELYNAALSVIQLNFLFNGLSGQGFGGGGP